MNEGLEERQCFLPQQQWAHWERSKFPKNVTFEKKNIDIIYPLSATLCTELLLLDNELLKRNSLKTKDVLKPHIEK